MSACTHPAIHAAGTLALELFPTREPRYPEPSCPRLPPDQAASSRSCESTAVPGNASMDAVCTSVLPSLRGTSSSALKSQAASTKSQPAEPTAGPSTAASVSVLLPVVPSAPAEGLSTGNISLPVGKSQEGPCNLPRSYLRLRARRGLDARCPGRQVAVRLVSSQDLVLSLRDPESREAGLAF